MEIEITLVNIIYYKSSKYFTKKKWFKQIIINYNKKINYRKWFYFKKNIRLILIIKKINFFRKYA